MTVLEIAANAVTTAAIVLAARNNVHTWSTGIVGCVLFGWLFYESQLYADALLQAFFLVTSVLGWMRWTSGNGTTRLTITASSHNTLLLSVAGGLVVALAYGEILRRFTNAFAPFWDSSILVASVIAQLLLMNRKLETWHFWLVVNTIAVPLFVSRGLWLTAVLYSAYWINALIAARRWRREMQGETAIA